MMKETITIEQFKALVAAHKELLSNYANLERQYNQLLKLSHKSRQKRFVAASTQKQSLPFEGETPVKSPEDLPTD